MQPTADVSTPRTPEHARGLEGPLGLRLIGVMKLTSAVLLAAAGLGIFRMINRDVGAELDHFLTRLHLDPENRLIHEGVAAVAGLDRAHLKAIGAGTFFYALLHLIEGTGLILLRRWAEYFTVIATGSLLPLEVYEVAHKVTWVRLGVLAVNLVVVAYLILRLKKTRRTAEAPAAG